MHLTYLDQCVVSRFLQKPENDPWRDLRETILKGNANVTGRFKLTHLRVTSN